MKNHKFFYIAGMSENTGGGIFCCRWVNALPEITGFTPLTRCLFLTWGKERKTLYATAQYNEIGKIAAYYVGANGKLILTDMVDAGGRSACFLAVSADGRHLYSANYASGNFSELTFDPDGKIIGDSRKTVDLGTNSHPHCCGFTPDEKMLYVVDAGDDKVIFYSYSPRVGITGKPVEIMELPCGSNPRHLFFDAAGKNAYVITEAGNSIEHYSWQNGKLYPESRVSTLLEKSTQKSSASTIKFSADGKFLFAGNRGDDSIAVFRIRDDGKLSEKKLVPSGGYSPRDFEFLAGDDILAVANEFSNEVSFFCCKQNTGVISAKSGSLQLPRPLYILT